jgi:glycosyltransferase involved in cell wall biosynthesis
MKLISIVTPCFNEEENIAPLIERLRAVFALLPQYRFEHILIDNASTDRTVAIIKSFAVADKRIKLIVNTRNFGHIRSPIHALLAANGDAVVGMASDLQDPPEMIPQFIAEWEKGVKMVLGVKPKSRETPLMFLARRFYYRTIGRISEIELVPNCTGFGLYDQQVMRAVRAIDDPYPYFRGLTAELGFDYVTIPFEQPQRLRGLSKNNFYTLYDLAMLGLTSHSKVPLRLATFAGFTLSALSMLIAFAYLIAKLIFWNSFSLGTAPVLIGIFFFASVQLFFIGILGEYIAAIHTQVMKRPLVIEKERVNFDPLHETPFNEITHEDQ